MNFCAERVIANFTSAGITRRFLPSALSLFSQMRTCSSMRALFPLYLLPSHAVNVLSAIPAISATPE